MKPLESESESEKKRGGRDLERNFPREIEKVQGSWIVDNDLIGGSWTIVAFFCDDYAGQTRDNKRTSFIKKEKSRD